MNIALSALILLLLAAPLHAQSPFRTALPETAKGDKLYAAERWSDALKEYSRLPSSPEVLKRMGAVQIKLWDMTSAIRSLRSAAKQVPTDMETKGFLAEALSWNKNFGEAAVLYKEVLASNDATTETRLSYARMLSWMKDLDGAIEQYRLAIKRNPENLEGHKGLGQMLAWKKQFDQSITAYRRIVEITSVPEYKSVALARIGQVQVWKGDVEAARSTYNAALRLDPNNIEAMFGLGELNEWSGSYPEAKALYEKILQVRPDHKAAKAKLVQLLWVK